MRHRITNQLTMTQAIAIRAATHQHMTQATLLSTVAAERDSLRAQILQLQQQLKDAQDEAAIANRQERTTHDALHDWKDHCSRYYMALRYLPIYADRQLADCHSPAAVLADLLEFAKNAIQANPYTPPSEQPSGPPYGLKAAHANAVSKS